MNKTRWEQLSPLLDELLDLEPDARLRRLAALRAEDASVADDLEGLLGHMTTNERDGFLERSPNVDVNGSDSDPGGMAGRTIGAYTIERELGHGGMGSVWLARRTDGRYDGMVAVKFLNMALAAGGGAARFAREGSILARLAHPNIARLVDAGVTRGEGQPYLVLEYIAGQTIDQYCEFRALGVEARVRLFLDVLAAVEHAHNRLILHRDIKPSNILVTEAGEVKLLDFGIAKLLDDVGASGEATELTRQAGGAFTPRFAAPEQVRGEEVTTATDVYALGVLLYVLLGRMHPTSNLPSTPVDQMRAVVEHEPKRLSEAVVREHPDDPDAPRLARQLRGDLDNIVAKALKKLPAQRYANAAQLADDLRRYLAHEPVVARRDAFVYRTAKFIRRHRLGVAAGGTVAVTLAVGISVALWQASEAHRQRVQAEGLIEFMLGDLRKKLQPVGRLDVLDAVGEKTLAYYAMQDAGRLDADSLGRRSRALHLIGEIHDKRDRLDDAQAAFVRAAETTAQLLAGAPNDGQRVFNHAQSVYWVGYMARRRGQLQDAEASFSAYLDLAQRLALRDANNLDWRLEGVYARYNLAVVYLETGRAADALTSLIAARDALSGMVAVRPELHFDLANAQGWIARAHEALGNLAAALQAQTSKVEALRKVPDAATNRKVMQHLATAGYEVALFQLDLGDRERAMTSVRGALDQLATLVALDPSNLVWLDQACFARLLLVEIDLASSSRVAARAEFRQAATDVGRVVPGEPLTRRQRMLVGRMLALQAQVAIDGGSTTVLQALTAYVANETSLEAAGKPLDVDQRRRLSDTQFVLGDVLARNGSYELAAGHWKTAAKRLAPLTTSRNFAAMTMLARTHVRLGESGSARTLAAQIQASTYRHPDYAALLDELAHGAGPWRRNSNPTKENS